MGFVTAVNFVAVIINVVLFFLNFLNIPVSGVVILLNPLSQTLSRNASLTLVQQSVF